MRIIYFANNWAGFEVLRFLKEQQPHEIVGLVLHPKRSQEMLDMAGLNPAHVFNGAELEREDVVKGIKDLRPDIGISVYFGHILRKNLLGLFPKGCVNLHPAFLPYNRGAYTNVWPIIEGTPAGVTLHYIDRGVDTGDIIAQSRVVVEPIDTGESLYHKLERECVGLFKRAWPMLCEDTPRNPQPGYLSTSHKVTDAAKVDEVDLERTYIAADLINLIRARTFPPYKGAYFKVGDRKVYLSLKLEEE